MPEFVLDYGTTEAARIYDGLDDFTQGYIEAMFFTDTGDADNVGLEHATFAELHAITLEAIKLDCTRFQTTNAADLDEAVDTGRIYGYDLKAAGRDFWYSRNGCGVGFWDRKLGDIGDKLHKAAEIWRQVSLYRGDDKLIHVDTA